MKTRIKPTAMIVLAMTAGFAMAQTTATTTTTISTTTTTAAPAPTTTVPAPETKLTAAYGGWAGSPENASALVSGLRTGKAITLTSARAGTSPTATTATFTPPTKPMGYGNIRIALNLAQQQLASQGITQPTPQQLQTALMGGSLTTGTGTTAQTTNMQGVLQMRASGMGWGKIANNLGYKLGPVMSGKAPATTTGGTTADGSASGTAAAKTTHGKAGSGITTAAGSGTANTGAGKTAHGKAGNGIVTAAGTSGGGITTGMGQSHGHAGVVTAQGGAGNSHAGGQGKGGK